MANIVKSSCLKFVYKFKDRLPDDMCPQFLNMIIPYFQSEQLVLKSYAAMTVDSLLLRTSINNHEQRLFTRAYFQANQELPRNLLSLVF